MEVDQAPSEVPESVTRCPCGDNEDNDGFMIQCETCLVWQHGECIGINPKDVPEEYFCELCQPNDPVHIKRAELFKLAQAGKLPAAPARRVRTTEKGRGKQQPNPNEKAGKRKRPTTKPSRPRQQNGPVAAPEDSAAAPAPVEEPNPNKRAKRPEPSDSQTDMNAAAIAIASLGAPPAVAPAQPAADGADAASNGGRAASREDRKIQWQIELMDKLAQDKKTPGPKQKAPTTPTTKTLNGPDAEDDTAGQPSRPSITVPPQSASKRPLVRGHGSPSSAHSGASSPTFISGVMAAPPPKPRHLHPLNPSYLGHKNWLLTAYKDSVRPQNGKTTPLNECALPINKRLLIACAPASSSSSTAPSESKAAASSPPVPDASAMNGLPRLLGSLPAHPRFSSLQDTHTPLRRGPHAATDILGLSSSSAALFASPAPSIPHPQSPVPQHFLEWAPQRRMMMGSHQTGSSSPIDEMEGRSPPQTPALNGDGMQRGVSSSSMDVDMHPSSAEAPAIPALPPVIHSTTDTEMATEAPSPPPAALPLPSQARSPQPTMNGIKPGQHSDHSAEAHHVSSNAAWVNGHVTGSGSSDAANGPVIPSSFAADHSLGLLQEQTTKSVHSGAPHSGTVAPL